MLRFLWPAFGLLALVPTAASAAPFGEPPFRSVSGAATCLRATGTPGELVRSTPKGVQFLEAGPAGLTSRDVVATSADDYHCPRAATRAGGAGIVAFETGDQSNGDNVIQARVREPGGAWDPVAEVLRSKGSANGATAAVAVSPSGDAIVASAMRSNTVQLEILAARRAPGGGFAAAETLSAVRANISSEARVRAGMTATGEAVVAWSLQRQPGQPRELWAAVAPPGAAFHAPVQLGSPRAGSPFDLAVGDNGHALVAFASGDDLFVAERAPGADFGASTRVGDAKDPFAVFPAAAVRADGGAVVAWQRSYAGMQAVVRQGPGPFGAPVTVAAGPSIPVDSDRLRLTTLLFGLFEGGEFGASGASPDSDGGNARATITPDGRALVTWAGAALRDDVWWGAPRSATLPLGGGPAELRDHGAELRDVGSITPVTLADGTAAVAWADNGERDRDGRLHLAVEGAADASDSAAPTVRLLAPRSRVLKTRDPLVLSVRCAAACDVRGTIAGDAGATEVVSLPRAGEARMEIEPANHPIATLRGGPLRVLLRYGAPGARRATAKSLTVQLRRPASPPRPRLLGALARRDGDDVVVSWRTDRNADSGDFFVFATASRARDAAALDLGEPKGSKRQFRLRLRKVTAARYVTVLSFADGAWSYRETTLRVKG